MIPVKFNATEAERQTFLAKKEDAETYPLGSGTTMRLGGTTTHKDKKQPLVVVNDRIVEIPDSVDFEKLDTEEQFANLLGIKLKDLKSIVVLKDDEATAKWGEKGKAGVIKITTKKAHIAKRNRKKNNP